MEFYSVIAFFKRLGYANCWFMQAPNKEKKSFGRRFFQAVTAVPRFILALAWKAVTAPFVLVWALIRFPFRLRKSGKERFILFSIFLLTIFAGILDWETAWNKSADFLNPKIDNALLFVAENTNSQFPKTLAERIAIGHLSVPFFLGLDVQGGTQLVYEADVSRIPQEDVRQTMQGLRDILERRVNALGVREPVVQVEETQGHYRILIELAGVKDIKAAVAAVGETPSLEFREESEEQLQELVAQLSQSGDIPPEQMTQLELQLRASGAGYASASPPLTGRYLTRATIEFDPNTSEPLVGLQFNDEGARIFQEMTRRNIGKTIGIFINNEIISSPVVQQEIQGGRAVITGTFGIEGARKLARNLNAGALDAPISLVFQETVGPSLGQDSLKRMIQAAVAGFGAVAVFMVLWYRLPGLIAVVALCIYSILVLALFKLVPVTMTLPGIAGFILSIGMAVDANILIFSRMREERKWGRPFASSISEGFARAWTSIRDSNVSTLITTAILFLVGTSFIKGFALTLGLGVLISMFTAVFVSRLLLKQFIGSRLERFSWLW